MQPPTRTQARRRRLAAVIGLAAVIAVGLVAWVEGASPTAVERTTSASVTRSAASSRTSVQPSATPSPAMPPAWLAWISGGFEPSFRADSTTLPGLDDVVVVAADTRWMTGSHDADNAVVDEPAPPYTIPIDAFAVAPSEYGPFVAPDVREEIVHALKQGEGVLGESSAKLRRLSPGGTMTFDGGITVKIGAVVPDDAVGWSELLVSRDVGRQLGIERDRYMLALTSRSFTEATFADLVTSLLPADTRIRVDAPGTTPYVRVASGVRPAVVFKQVFGEYSAYPDPGNPAYLTIDPDWVRNHILTRSVPLLGSVTCNKALFPQLIGALTEMQDRGLGGLIHVYSGCWAARTVARSPTAPPSYHSYGAAIDINAPENPYGEPPVNMDPRMVRIFERWGFNWGGDFLIPDGHHFEYWGPPKTG